MQVNYYISALIQYGLCKKLFEACKDTIEKYNRRVASDYDNSTIWGMACELTRMTFGDVGSRQFVTV